MVDLLGLDTLLAELIVAVGLALLVGNGAAWWRHRRGGRPAGVEGTYRPGRVRFLSIIGVLMTAWGVASLVT